MSGSNPDIEKFASKSFNKSSIDEKAIIGRLSAAGIFGNIALAAIKFVAGILGHSSALISDGIHSLSDTLATFIALIGVKISKRSPDAGHPYGHERFECAASMILGIILIVTSIGIGYNGISVIVTGDYDRLDSPTPVAIIIAAASIVIKEAMFWYTRHWARILKSSAFMADAWHHRSDALSSVAAVIGIGGSMLGVAVMDPLASVVICFFILKVAFDIEREALDNMVDSTGGIEITNEIRDYIQKQDGVAGIDRLQTRKFGKMIYVEAEIEIDGNLTLREAHVITGRVHDGVEQHFEDVKHIMIQANPAN